MSATRANCVQVRAFVIVPIVILRERVIPKQVTGMELTVRSVVVVFCAAWFEYFTARKARVFVFYNFVTVHLRQVEIIMLMAVLFGLVVARVCTPSGALG